MLLKKKLEPPISIVPVVVKFSVYNLFWGPQNWVCLYVNSIYTCSTNIGYTVYQFLHVFLAIKHSCQIDRSSRTSEMHCTLNSPNLVNSVLFQS